MRMRPTPELFNWSLRAQQTDLYLALRQVKEKFPSPGMVQAPARTALLPELWPTFPITFLQGVPNAQGILLAFR